MKNILILLAISACLISCNSAKDESSEKIPSPPKPVLGDAVEGVGIYPIILGEATRDTVVKYFSYPSEVINHKGYSIEMVYREYGISFFFVQKDPSQMIIAIECNTSFKGKTQKGFLISSMTVADMIRIYGHPQWQPLGDSSQHARFNEKGIYFTFNRSEEIEEIARKIREPEEEEKKDNIDTIRPENEVIGDFGDDPVMDSIYNSQINHFYDSAYARYKITELTIEPPHETLR